VLRLSACDSTTVRGGGAEVPRLRLAWRLDHGACPRRLARCGRQAPRFTPPAPPPRAPPPIAPPYLGSAREALRHLEHLNKGRISVPLAPPPSTAAPPLRGRFAACVSSAVHLSTTAALTRSFSEAGAPRSAAHCSASSCISSHVSRAHPRRPWPLPCSPARAAPRQASSPAAPPPRM